MSMPTQSQTNQDDHRILLFVRAPQRGHVKTRLAKQLGADITLALYRSFVEDIITTLKSGSYPTAVFYTPEDQGASVQAWLGKHARCHPQIGTDLGRRMQTAFILTFCEPVAYAVLIGSDFPDLDIEIIHEAFRALRENDVVVGPATDGGYYLIGFQKDALNADVFQGIQWGSRKVWQQTLDQIEHADLTYHTLPVWQDIDTYEDLMAFYARNKIVKPGLKTIKYLTGVVDNLKRKAF